MPPTTPEELPIGEPVDGIAAQPPVRRSLEGRYVTVRPVEPERDAEPLWRSAHDGSAEAARMWTYMPYGPFADPPAMRGWLDGCAPVDDPLFMVIDSRHAGPVGMAAFMNVDRAHRRIELGHIWYAPPAQRTEANTEAAYLMLREAFDRLGYHRVEWKCDALNERSRSVAVRLGFTLEGVFRRHMVVKGRNRDTAWFSMIDDEWPDARTAFERWLGADADARPPLASLR